MTAPVDGRLVLRRAALGRPAWDELVDRSPEAWLWHRYDLQDALQTWPDRDDESFAVTNAVGEPLAVVPLQVVTPTPRRGRPRTMESLGGPAYRVDLEGADRQGVECRVALELEKIARRRHTASVRLSVAPMAEASRVARTNALLRLGAMDVSGETWVIDLRGGEEQVWQGMTGRARTAVRKAEKSGLTVRRASRDDLPAYYSLHLETYRRTGARPHPLAYFESIWDRFVAAGLARVLLAEVEGRIVAAQNFGVFRGAGVYWTGAAADDGLRLGANNLLQWEGIRGLVADGVSWFESGEAFFAGAEPKLVALSNFKRSFGGEPVPLHRAVIDTSTATQRLVAALARTGRRAVRRR